jgi:hypothetical protein
MEPFDISGLDKRRFGLKCTCCKSKGACVQCAYGRCSTAAHPWCALSNSSSEYTHRIIKNSTGGSDWEIFCQQHAGAVKEAAKPKKNWGGGYPSARKAGGKKRGGDSEDESDEYDDDGNDDRANSKQKKKGSTKKKAIGKSKGDESDPEFDPSDVHVYDDDFDLAASSRGRGRPRGSTKERGDYTNLADAVFDQEYWCKMYADTQLALEEKDSKESDMRQKIFKVLTLSEWPGQNEGEAMDLSHYWRFIAMAFPEDQSMEWVDYMCSIVKNVNEKSPEMIVPSISPEMIVPSISRFGARESEVDE